MSGSSVQVAPPPFRPVEPVAKLHDGSVEQPSGFCSKMRQIVEIIAQIAVQILFIAISIVTAGAAFPPIAHVVVIPAVAFGSALLAGFFFAKPDSIFTPYFDFPKPLIELLPPAAPGLMPANLPRDAPRGIDNESNNCWINALTQFFAADPQLAEWLRNAPILQGAYGKFLTAYNQALQDNLAVVNANSQELRIALNKIAPGISASANEQVDAAEAMLYILNMLPHEQKMRIQTTYHLDSKMEPPPVRNLVEKEEGTAFFTLEFDPSQSLSPRKCCRRVPPPQPPRFSLEEMYRKYVDHKNEEPYTFGNMREIGMDGNLHAYPIVRGTVHLLQAPPVLRFQIKRFTFSSPDSLAVKIDAPIESPPELEIALASGEKRRYRLASFVHHSGSDNHGHYTAGRIVNGQKYLISDAKVISVDHPTWEKLLQEAYLLCYLPV